MNSTAKSNFEVVTAMLNSPPTFNHINSDAEYSQHVAHYYRIILQAALSNFSNYVNQLIVDDVLVAVDVGSHLELLQRAVTAFTMANTSTVRSITPRVPRRPAYDPRPEDLTEEESSGNPI